MLSVLPKVVPAAGTLIAGSAADATHVRNFVFRIGDREDFAVRRVLFRVTNGRNRALVLAAAPGERLLALNLLEP